jgi:hypothetical protein
LINIPVRLKQPDIETIGIVIDADVNIKTRWVALSSLLTSLGFNMPAEINEDGLIIESNELRIGIWIMPNNSLNGMIEDFIAFLVPIDDLLLKEAYNTLEHIELQKLNRYSHIHKSKALIHTWLSWQEDPGKPMGLAITKKYLSTDEEVCMKFINWIKNTFQESIAK